MLDKHLNNRFQKGLGFMHGQCFEEAIEIFDEVLLHVPSHSSSSFNKITCLRLLKRPEEALAICEQLLQHNTDQNMIEIYQFKSNVLLELDRFEEALEACEVAFQLDYPFIRLYEHFEKVQVIDEHNALLYDPDNNLIEAFTITDRKFNFPLVARLYNSKANALVHLDRQEEAIQNYRRAAIIDPTFNLAFSNLGDRLYEQNKFEEALEAYEKAIVLVPNDGFLYNDKANTLVALKRGEEAILAYNQAILLRPDIASAYYYKAGLLRYLGRLEESLESFKMAQKLGYEEALAIEQWL